MQPFHIHQMRTGIFAAIFTLLAGCGRHSESLPVTSAGLVGVWQLESIADKPPGRFNLQDYQAEFLGDGTWKFRATLAGHYAGTYAKGSGTWKLDGDVLHYSVGANTGLTHIAIAGTVLTMSPDPAVTPDGQTKVETRYKKANQQ
jgi:hypothetical protein